MKGSEKKVSFSTPPIQSSASPKGSDENDRSNQELGLNLQNPKKETVKNFMSPTVSAASKASFRRRKILAERNESPVSNFSNTYLSKPPNLDSKASPKTIPKASQKNSPNLDPKANSKEPSSQKTPSSYSSRDETPSPRPYDPLTNYLSPRPQFLRYNPNRRNEIFLRLKMEDKEDDEVSVCSTSSFDSKKASGDEADSVSSDGSLSEQEHEEFDIESDEESEEEVGWSLRGALKYLLVLVVLLLTTTYISSMNSPTPSQAFEGLTLGCKKIHNHSNGIVESVEVGHKFLDGKQEQLGLLGLNEAIVDEGIQKEMVENVNLGEIVSLELVDGNYVEYVEMVEEVEKDGKSEDACEEELVKGADVSDQFVREELIKDVEKVEYLNKNGETENKIEDELVETKEVSDQVVENIELQETEETVEQIEDVEMAESVKETAESEDVIEEELVKTGEVSDKKVGDIELLGQETAGEIESIQGDQAGLLSEGTDHQEAASQTTASSEKERVAAKEVSEEIHNEARDDDMVQANILESEVTVLERSGKSSTFGNLNFEEVNPLKGLNQQIGTEVFLKVMFGVLTCAAIVASLVSGSNIRRKGIASKHASLVEKHSTKPVVKEEPSSVLSAEREVHKKLFDSFMNTMPLVNSADKDIKESYQSRAPSVDLLGEFDVGAISSSLKSRAIKSRMKDEVSSYSDFLEKGFGSKAYSAPVQDQQDISEFSTVNSTSSERLAVKKKILRKELANNDMAELDGEGRNVVTTPLRRSARIRNRAVASP
ncbi:uncharacterized protein LOC110424425 isoform X2 [Herrania umbratica]|uniref:Uncharacterized protein LOC110424425 isoform X2 n=1 Tax=Herrania umbratica TaxID=108875 RepID=A0A6J1B5J5_9ROSI|nr:uncharacterized protein LOC110424425 isoform X2 [Herrania umbratica]